MMTKVIQINNKIMSVQGLLESMDFLALRDEERESLR